MRFRIRGFGTKKSMKNIAQIIGALLVIHTGLMAQTRAAANDYKRLSFDQFFDGQLEPIKLSLEIPAQYVHAEGLGVPDDSYSYWMEGREVAGVKETMALPSKTGYIYGKLSMEVGFDQKTNRFTNEEDLEASNDAEWNLRRVTAMRPEPHRCTARHERSSQ